MRRFYIGFFSVLALFIVLNAAPYFLSSTPQLRTIGLLSPFWRQDPTFHTRLFLPAQSGTPYTVNGGALTSTVAGQSSTHVEPRFYWDKFAINLCIALAASFSIGRWYQQRGEKNSSTKTSNDNVA